MVRIDHKILTITNNPDVADTTLYYNALRPHERLMEQFVVQSSLKQVSEKIRVTSKKKKKRKIYSRTYVNIEDKRQNTNVLLVMKHYTKCFIANNALVLSFLSIDQGQNSDGKSTSALFVLKHLDQKQERLLGLLDRQDIQTQERFTQLQKFNQLQLK